MDRENIAPIPQAGMTEENTKKKKVKEVLEYAESLTVVFAVMLLIFTFIAFAIAQFGLMAVVKQGYAYLGYAALITLFIPFVLHAIITRGREI